MTTAFNRKAHRNTVNRVVSQDLKALVSRNNLEVTEAIHHPCDCCTVCHEDLTLVEKAYTGFQTINIEFGNTDKPGVHLSNTYHIYYTGRCPNCGLENRSEPWRAPADTSDWNGVGMTQWRLIGPDLAALIVYLSMDMRVTRRKVKQFLLDVFGLEISVGTLQNCIIESARISARGRAID